MGKLRKMAFSIILGAAALSAVYLYFPPQTRSSSISVQAVYDPARIGELNMVKALIEATPLVGNTYEIVEKPNAQFKDLKLDKDKSYIIITAGQFGINFLKSASPLQSAKVLLCAHQWFDDMKNLHDIYLTMPHHAIDERIRKWAKKQKIELIPTQGALHIMSVKSLDGQDTSSVHLSDAKIGLLLGGDAEMPNGVDWRLFSVENARKLANEISELIKKTGYKVLITNSPRTGAFINATTRNPKAHKDGEIDKVSKAFLDELTKSGLKEREDFEFHDFQFGAPSALKAILAVIYKNKGFMIVPGESTSSTSEITSILPTTIYINDAMNHIHEAYLTELTNNRVADLWPNIPSPNQMNVYVLPKSQAIKVIEKIHTTPH